MMGLHFLGSVPFHTVYIHALVRDEKGQKMSKSKGNVIDPIELIDKYGADALRFTLTAFAAQGRDVKMSESRVEGYRNFATKLWNAARFCQINGCDLGPGFDPLSAGLTVNRWIIGKLAETATTTTAAIEDYRFNEAAAALYQFTWGTFCDWYLEFTKPIFQGTDGKAVKETRAVTAWILERLLHLLHPIIPYITEELWQELTIESHGPLITAPWPDLTATLIDEAAAEEMDWVVRLISNVRAIRAEMNVPAAAKTPLLLKDLSAASTARMETHRDLIITLARLASIEPLDGGAPKGAVQDVLDEATVILPLAEVIDMVAEKARLGKEIARLDGEIDKHDRKLANANFTAKAPAAIVDTERQRRAEADRARSKLAEALNRLASM